MCNCSYWHLLLSHGCVVVCAVLAIKLNPAARATTTLLRSCKMHELTTAAPSSKKLSADWPVRKSMERQSVCGTVRMVELHDNVNRIALLIDLV